MGSDCRLLGRIWTNWNPCYVRIKSFSAWIREGTSNTDTFNWVLGPMVKELWQKSTLQVAGIRRCHAGRRRPNTRARDWQSLERIIVPSGGTWIWRVLSAFCRHSQIWEVMITIKLPCSWFLLFSWTSNLYITTMANLLDPGSSASQESPECFILRSLEDMQEPIDFRLSKASRPNTEQLIKIYLSN